MRRPIDNEEFGRLLAAFERTAFRLELQPAYNVAVEREPFHRWLDGDRTAPTAVPELADWFRQIADLTRHGRSLMRVRVQDEPLADYQRWENWCTRWNVAAGEHVRRMSRAEAYDCGLLPVAGSNDWWLLDNCSMVIMGFDSTGRRVDTELVDDPTIVEQARVWRDLAIHHSVRDSGEPQT